MNQENCMHSKTSVIIMKYMLSLSACFLNLTCMKVWLQKVSLTNVLWVLFHCCSLHRCDMQKVLAFWLPIFFFFLLYYIFKKSVEYITCKTIFRIINWFQRERFGTQKKKKKVSKSLLFGLMFRFLICNNNNKKTEANGWILISKRD